MQRSDSSLEHFPITFFAIVMGLAGLSMAWRAASLHMPLWFDLQMPIYIAACVVFGLVAVLYLFKIVRHFGAVKQEFNHPVKMNFFPTFSISLILLSICTKPHSSEISSVLFWLGISVHLILTFAIIGVWVHQDKFEITHMNPSWFIPVVGNILIPVIGVPMGQIEISWFFFSIGAVFWIVLMTIFFNRIIFHHRLPPQLMPTFFILIAPPAVGFTSYLQLHPSLDSFAQTLYGFGLFLTLFLFSQIRWFKGLPFALSWWAYSFPMAAITIASYVMYDISGATLYHKIAMVLLGLATVLIFSLLVRTLVAISKKGICLPEPPASSTP